MTAVSEVESLRNLLREQGFGSALASPSAPSLPPASTGLTALDALLGGGIPRGQINELIGQTSSGRTSVAFAILAEATMRGEVAAYIDATDSLDPRSAQKAGIELQRLLWVRCGKQGSDVRYQGAGRSNEPGKRFPDPRNPKPDTFSSSAWQAVNLVASAGGFGVIVLDLGGVPKRRLREWQSRQWLRLRRAIEHSPTALLILASEHLASSISALVIEIAREKTLWQGTPGVSLRLSGISSKVRVAHQRKNAVRDTGPEAACSLGIGD